MFKYVKIFLETHSIFWSLLTLKTKHYVYKSSNGNFKKTYSRKKKKNSCKTSKQHIQGELTKYASKFDNLE